MKLPSWPVIEELGLIANAVKHGGGGFTDRLRATKPELFKSIVDDAEATKIFWDEIIAAMRPDLAGPQP